MTKQLKPICPVLEKDLLFSIMLHDVGGGVEESRDDVIFDSSVWLPHLSSGP